jgi:hypothetical protein
VDQVHEGHVLRQLHRQEAVGLDPETREEAPVGHGGQQERYGLGRGIELPQGVCERPEQGEVGLRSDRVVAQDLELHLHARERAQLREEVLGTEPRKQTAVEVQRDLSGDDVDLLSA